MLKNQDIICISMTFWDAVWLSNHQYMKRLSEHNRVLYVERPVTFLSYFSPNQREFVSRQIGRWWSGGVRQISENLYVASPPPVSPLRFEKPINWFNQQMRARWAQGAARKLGFQNPLLWIYDPDAGAMIGHVGEKMALYAVTDDHPTMAQRSNRVQAMRAREQELLERSDLVLTTTENLRDIKREGNPNTHYVPHGIDSAHFSKALDPTLEPMPELAEIRGTMIGIIGQINQRIDVETLTEAARRHPEWTLVFIGPVVRERVDISAMEAMPNIRFLGRRSSEDLPRYLKSISLCLIPYHLDDHTRYMHPLKTLEYLAAGRPVVASPLPALEIYGEYIQLAGDTETFIAAMERALAEDTPEKQQARAAYASQHTWEHRLEKISTLVESTLASKKPQKII